VTLVEALEASALAEHLRRSRWTYPLVNAGHVAGIALLVGAVVPMAVTSLRNRRAGRALIRALRPFAVAGLVLAVVCGGLLFIAQAGDYVANPWFQAKLALIALALANAAWHLRRGELSAPAALASILLWSGALVAGRMIGFS
jgi:putative intracellular protease/amidase